MNTVSQQEQKAGEKLIDVLKFRVEHGLYVRVWNEVKESRTSIQHFCAEALKQYLEALDANRRNA